jgi:hypothetical protein
MAGVALAAVVVVGAMALTLANSGEGNEANDQVQENDGGGDAAGICLEGATDCVDTVDPGAGTDAPDGTSEDKPQDPDTPITSEPGDGDGSPAVDCSAPDVAEECKARATELALADLSDRLRVDASAITVVSIEDAVWDGCMGVAPPEGEACTEIGILGYKIILEHAGVSYEYHTDQGSRAVLAS